MTPAVRAAVWAPAAAFGIALLAAPKALADGPAPDIGAAFVFDDGRVERFVGEAGENRVWATRRGREYTRTANPAVPILEWEVGGRSGKSQVHGHADALWPPRPGASARFRVRTTIESNGRAQVSARPWTCRIGAEETVETPAGDFPALPIRCERYSLNTMRLAEQRTWWWSDEVGHYVRRRYQSYRTGESRDIALCAALPPHRVNTARIEAVVERCASDAS